jgi:hypothetical protein
MLEEGGKRECIVARNVPHAMQVWGESGDAFSRSLELVISGGWLMQLLELNGLVERIGEGGPLDDDCERAKIAEVCIQGLVSDDERLKQQCLEQVLVSLGYNVDEIKRRFQHLEP